MLITEFAEVNINTRNIAHYKELGYNVSKGMVVLVKIEHLTKGSHALVEVECDYCKDIIYKPYYQYLKQREIIPKDSCGDCLKYKRKDSNLERYGFVSYFETDEFKIKSQQTFLNKYGVTNCNQTKEAKLRMKKYWKNLSDNQIRKMTTKRKQTCLKKYGVESIMQKDEIKNKAKQTNLDKYGTEYYAQTDEFKKRVKETCLEKYGVESISQLPETKEKVLLTLLNNGGEIPTSKQQIATFEIIKTLFDENNVFLNYPFDYYCLDVALVLDYIKIDIEYDGWYWHQDKEKDKYRNDYLINKNWKVLRIKSGVELPTINQLRESLNILINTNEMYQEIILDDWKEVAV